VNRIEFADGRHRSCGVLKRVQERHKTLHRNLHKHSDRISVRYRAIGQECAIRTLHYSRSASSYGGKYDTLNKEHHTQKKHHRDCTSVATKSKIIVKKSPGRLHEYVDIALTER
jgi:hypothetical protein